MLYAEGAHETLAHYLLHDSGSIPTLE
jgi:hypothetical protein